MLSVTSRVCLWPLPFLLLFRQVYRPRNRLLPVKTRLPVRVIAPVPNWFLNCPAFPVSIQTNNSWYNLQQGNSNLMCIYFLSSARFKPFCDVFSCHFHWSIFLYLPLNFWFTLGFWSWSNPHFSPSNFFLDDLISCSVSNCLLYLEDLPTGISNSSLFSVE